ncbi:condensation domain-containing protein, partial [Dimargaris cristalligena]
LRHAWAQVLQMDPNSISTTDHFFRIGGDSISAILLVSKGQQLGFRLTVPLIYQYPELGQLAHYAQRTCLNINETHQRQILGEELNIRHIPLTQLDDLLPCIAVQGGLLASLSKDPSSYLIQMAVTISGPLDSGRLIFAWNRVANQHAPLRTVFMESSAKQSQGFVQAVLRSSLASWTITDIPLDSLNDFFITNRRRGFNLHDQMIRNFVFPTADGLAHQVIVTIHHSLIDGWSLPLLLQQWKLAYHHPAMLVPAPLTGFSAVVDHVHKLDPIPAKAFWADYLLDAPVTPAPLLSPNYVGSPGFATYSTQLEISRSVLKSFTQQLGITLATLFQAAYAIVLGRLLDQDDVVFGVTVSGRNLDLPAMNEVLGPCTNT